MIVHYKICVISKKMQKAKIKLGWGGWSCIQRIEVDPLRKDARCLLLFVLHWFMAEGSEPFLSYYAPSTACIWIFQFILHQVQKNFETPHRPSCDNFAEFAHILL